MSTLTTKSCTPCKGGVQPMQREEAESYLGQTPGWELNPDATKITRSFKFSNFAKTFEFVSDVAGLAETEDHHPDICFGYGNCTIEIQTHKIGGLHENDFILAAKINEAAET